MPNTPTQRSTQTQVWRDGKPLITFGGCNYHGLAQHPRVIEASRTALEHHGLSSTASRETTGNTLPHEMLEAELTEYTGFQSATLLPDGYTANFAAFQGLAAQGIERALLDERAHSSLYDSAKLGSMRIETFNHLDHDHALRALLRDPAPTVIATDSVFATDGRIAPVTELARIRRTQDTLLLDDCHGFTVLGDQGQGIAAHAQLDLNPNLIVTTSLLKGLGGVGGVILSSARTISAVRDHAKVWIGTTPASPALVEGTRIALSILRTDPDIHDALRTNSESLRAVLRSHGITAHDDPVPIFAFAIGSEREMREIERSLIEQGVLVPLIAYPNGPFPCYFRAMISSAHCQDQVDLLDRAFGSALKRNSSASVLSSP